MIKYYNVCYVFSICFLDFVYFNQSNKVNHYASEKNKSSAEPHSSNYVL